jgi:hypothetical protein
VKETPLIISPGRDLNSHWKVVKTVKDDKAILVFKNKNNGDEKTTILENNDYRSSAASEDRAALLGKKTFIFLQKTEKR